MKKYQKGFGSVVLLIILVIGLASTAGWVVYSRQKNKSNLPAQTSQMQQNSQATTYTDANVVSKDKSVTLLGNNITVTSGILPEGWRVIQGCDKSLAHVIILPTDISGIKCGTEDAGFMSIGIIDAKNTNAPRNCDNANTLRDQDSKYDWFVSYDCVVVTVNDMQGVQETTVENENAPFGGANTYTQFTFRLSDKTAVTASLTNSKDLNRPQYTDIFNNFVNTLKFK